MRASLPQLLAGLRARALDLVHDLDALATEVMAERALLEAVTSTLNQRLEAEMLRATRSDIEPDTTSQPAAEHTPAKQGKQPARSPRVKDAGSPKPAAGDQTPATTPPPAEDFPEDEPPAHMVPGAARKPTAAERVALIKQRAAMMDDPARSGRKPVAASAGTSPSRGARNVVLL